MVRQHVKLITLQILSNHLSGDLSGSGEYNDQRNDKNGEECRTTITHESSPSIAKTSFVIFPRIVSLSMPELKRHSECLEQIVVADGVFLITTLRQLSQNPWFSAFLVSEVVNKQYSILVQQALNLNKTYLDNISCQHLMYI